MQPNLPALVAIDEGSEVLQVQVVAANRSAICHGVFTGLSNLSGRQVCKHYRQPARGWAQRDA